MNLYPVNLKIENRICLIVGGGEVGVRKIGPLVSCGARVVVVSPDAVPQIAEMAESGIILWHRRAYHRGDMDGALLVFAATDNREVQHQVAEEAAEKNILVNSADDSRSCSFQVPARVRRGNFLLTVSTGGGSPALAAKLRRELADEYGSEYQLFVELLGRIRERIVDDGKTQASHKAVFENLLQLDILARIRQRDWTTLRHELSGILPGDMDIADLIASLHTADATESLESGDAQSPLTSNGQSEQ